MNRINQYLLLSVCFFICCNTFCENKNNKTKIGVILPLTGPATGFGEKIKNSLLQQHNKNIELIFEDEACDPKKGLNAYKRLKEKENILIFIGPACGAPQTIVAQQIANKDVVAIVPNSAPENIFHLSKGKMFSPQHSTEAESKFIAEEIFKQNYKKVTPIFFESEFTRSHEKSFRDNYKGEITESLVYTAEDMTLSQAFALKIKQLNPDAIYIPDAFPVLFGLLNELVKLNLSHIPVYGIYASELPEMKNAIGTNKTKFYYSFPKIGDADPFTHYPIKALKLLSEAISVCEKSKESTNVQSMPSCVREEFSKDTNMGKAGFPVEEFVVKGL